MKQSPDLSPEEHAIYEWQLSVPGFGEEGQKRLKGASVLVSRCGGVGGAVAYYLAAAGVGRLVLAHGGNLKPSDLNRQILMTHDWLGRPRVECAARRLKELNPRIEIVAVAENVTEVNAANLVSQVDLVASCAPLFTERLLMNREAVGQGKPLVDCAMYELEGQITTVVPKRKTQDAKRKSENSDFSTPCLACLYPQEPPAWKRQFPVFGAVSGMIGAMGAMEAIKVLSGLGEPLAGRMLTCDLRDMSFRVARITRRADCPICGGK